MDLEFGRSKRDRWFALVDCNNFYVSCERVFRPELRGKPVVVLSNNDGCVIARSDEAKNLGIPMAVPKFQVDELLREHEVHVFSSNYPLYGDMSRRVVTTLESFTPDLEEYSVDEVFMDLTEFARRDLEAYGERMVREVDRRTGIPISVGLAPTRTLAKLANERAKERGKRVVQLTPGPELDRLLGEVEPEDLWGIGTNRSETLRSAGFETARDLRDAPEAWLKSELTVEGLRIAYELKGISCRTIRDVNEPRENIMTSRSFGRRIVEFDDLREAVTRYVVRATEKAREQDAAARVLMVFLRTGRFGSGPKYRNSTITKLTRPTAATAPMVRRAHRGLKKIFRPGYRYKKAGVMLGDLVPAREVQNRLFGETGERLHEEAMEVLDEINDEYGSNTLRPASAGLDPDWTMKSEHRSPHYTTRWTDLPVVRAG